MTALCIVVQTTPLEPSPLLGWDSAGVPPRAPLSTVTLKVYVGAISASHVPFIGASVGRYPLVSYFFCMAPDR